MDIIQLKGGGTAKYAPRTTEAAMYPNIDSNFTTMAYQGPRIVLRDEQVCGFRQMPDLPFGGQGMAIYDDIVIRMTTGTGHFVFRIADDGTTTQVTTFTASTGHSNSLQFAPTLESGQTYPYLYVAELPDACSVLSLSSTFVATAVQRITIASGVVEGGNLQIGDDGYLWYSGCIGANSASKWRFVKFRKVLVSEGDVTLTSDDILDDWTTTEVRPYSTHAFQGFIVKFGKIFQVYGYGAGQNYYRGYAVYDTATHAFVTEIDLTSTFTEEPEDVDVWQDSLLLGCLSKTLYQFKF